MMEKKEREGRVRERERKRGFEVKCSRLVREEDRQLVSRLSRYDNEHKEVMARCSEIF